MVPLRMMDLNLAALSKHNAFRISVQIAYERSQAKAGNRRSPNRMKSRILR